MMSSTKLVLFYEKCRLCLDKAGVSDIFQSKGMLMSIFDCTGVKITPSDNLPQKICVDCAEIVAKATTLREIASKNDSHLRSLFNIDPVDDDAETVQIGPEDCQQDPTNYVVITHFSSDSDCASDTNTCEKNKLPKTKHQEAKCQSAISLTLRKDLFDVSSTTQVEARKQKRKRSFNPKTDNKYECKICSKTYETHKKLYLHNRLHNKSMICPLDACGKKFATKGDLEKHLRTHTGVKPFTCDICDKSFSQQGTLKTHKENVHYSYTLK